MKVRAKQDGWYGSKLRVKGEEFELHPRKGHSKSADGELTEVELTVEEQFSAKWMERVGHSPSASKPKSNKPVAEKSGQTVPEKGRRKKPDKTDDAPEPVSNPDAVK